MENELPLTESMPFREAAQALVETPLLGIISSLEGVRSGDNIDAVHDLRVASRRLRAVISAIEPAFAGKDLDRFERAAASLSDLLGEARDTDVFIEHLNAEITLIDDSRAYERVGVEAFRDSLRQKRAELQEKLMQGLASVDEHHLRHLADDVFAQKERL